MEEIFSNMFEQSNMIIEKPFANNSKSNLSNS